MAGMGSSFDDDDDIISGINVTPLVDIALVLLIIFIATSAIIVRAAVNVDLPKSATAEEVLPEYVSVLLDNDGNYYLDGDRVTRDQLVSLISAQVENNPELRALVAASRTIDYGRVMDAIDAVREANVAGFSLNVERARAEDSQ